MPSWFKRGQTEHVPAQREGAHGFFSVYPLQLPSRPVPVRVPASAACEVKVRIRSNVFYVQSPSSTVGPEPVHTPVSGHNVVITISATGTAPVVVGDVSVRVRGSSPMSADGVLVAHERMPDYAVSPDLLESVERAVANYQPLQLPHLEANLDDRSPVAVPALDAAGTRARSDLTLPVTVPPGSRVELVVAPLTRAHGLTRWQLGLRIDTDVIDCELTVTAADAIRTFRPGSERLADLITGRLVGHWAPGGAIAREWNDIEVLGHITEDGTGLLRAPARSGPAPEPEAAAALRYRADELSSAGEKNEALTVYAAAAEAGSAPAAYSAGLLCQRAGDTAESARWYRRAAEGNFMPAFNNLGAVALLVGDLAEAERWLRRGIDAGDWAAAANLGVVYAKQGKLEQAEQWFRQAADHDIHGALTNRAAMLQKLGRTKEAEQQYGRAAEDGNVDAMVRMGHYRFDAKDLAGAETWWRRAYDAGSNNAGCLLGRVLLATDREADAERQWRETARRAPSGSAESGADFGVRVDGGSDDHGAAESALWLGRLFKKRNDTTEAVRWLQESHYAGNAEASVEMADIFGRRGDIRTMAEILGYAVRNPAAPTPTLELIGRQLAGALSQAATSNAFTRDDVVLIGRTAAAAYRRLAAEDPGKFSPPLGTVLAALAEFADRTGDPTYAAELRAEAAGLTRMRR
jgi:TPR repeat protein